MEVNSDSKTVHFSSTDLLIISIVAMVVGMISTFAGKKLFQAALFIAGFIALGGATYYVMQMIAINHDSIHFSKVVSLVVPLAVGLIGGCIVIGLVRLGFFLAGAAVGAVMAFVVISLFGSHFGAHAFWIKIAVLVALCIVGGVVVLHQQKRLLILITSIGGAYLTFAGLDHFVHSGYNAAMYSFFVKDENMVKNASPELLGMLAGAVGLALVGILVQWYTNRKRSGWDDEDDYLLSSRRKVNF